MKKSLIVFAVLLLPFYSFSQTLGIKAGFSHMSNTFEEGERLLGVNFGVTLDKEISDHLSVESAFSFHWKGVEKDRIHLHYLELPIALKGGFNITDGMRLYALAGPFLSMGLAGYYVVEDDEVFSADTSSFEVETINNDDDKIFVKWGGNSGLNWLDGGLVFGAGVEINEVVQLGVSYMYGMMDMYQDTSVDATINTMNISLAYRFVN